MTQFAFIFFTRTKCAERKNNVIRKNISFSESFLYYKLNKNYLIGRVIQQIRLLKSNFHFTFIFG